MNDGRFAPRPLSDSLSAMVKSAGPGDTDAVISAAETNGVSTLLHEMTCAGTEFGLDDTCRRSLRDSAQKQALVDMVINHGTRRLLERLGEAKIDALLLKGTPIAHLHYSSSHLRTRCDSDLYIAESAVPHAVDLLTQAGYAVSGHDKRKHSSKQFLASDRSVSGLAVHFDVHWKLSNRVLFADTLPFGECWGNRQPVPAIGENAWALCDIDLLLHACIHRIAHGRGTARNRLIWLYDIHLLWNAMNEQEKQAFTEKALDKKIGALCADALMICEKLFTQVGAARAAISHSIDILKKNRKQEPTARLINASKTRWALADMMAIEGLTEKLTFAKELILKK